MRQIPSRCKGGRLSAFFERRPDFILNEDYKQAHAHVLGRRGDVDLIQMRAIQGDLPQVDVRTYDDVIEKMKRRLTINPKI